MGIRTWDRRRPSWKLRRKRRNNCRIGHGSMKTWRLSRQESIGRNWFTLLGRSANHNCPLLGRSANHNCPVTVSRKNSALRRTANSTCFVIHQKLGISKDQKPESQRRNYFCIAVATLQRSSKAQVSKRVVENEGGKVSQWERRAGPEQVTVRDRNGHHGPNTGFLS